jgi:hypothetical protein
MHVTKNIFGKWEVRAFVKTKNKGIEDMEIRTYSADSGADALRMFSNDMRKERKRVQS